jgi:hypothetical protein
MDVSVLVVSLFYRLLCFVASDFGARFHDSFLCVFANASLDASPAQFSLWFGCFTMEIYGMISYFCKKKKTKKHRQDC